MIRYQSAAGITTTGDRRRGRVIGAADDDDSESDYDPTRDDEGEEIKAEQCKRARLMGNVTDVHCNAIKDLVGSTILQQQEARGMKGSKPSSKYAKVPVEQPVFALGTVCAAVFAALKCASLASLTSVESPVEF
jgi:hypothetical protein